MIGAISAAEQAAPPGRVSLVLEASTGWAPLRLGELWRARELLYFMVWRDVKVRYKQTLVGVIWSLLQPLALMLLFTVIFGHLAKLPTDGVPYPIFFFSGYVVWQVFVLGLNQAATSLVSNQHLLTKVYFPRLLIPVSAVVAGFLDFLISLCVLLGFYAYYGIGPYPSILFLPVVIVLVAAAAIGVGTWLAALNVRYRDVQAALPFLTQFWFFATPIAFAPTLIPKAWMPVYAANPMVGVIDSMRWALFHQPPAVLTPVLEAVVVIAVLLVTGLAYFRRMERSFADVV